MPNSANNFDFKLEFTSNRIMLNQLQDLFIIVIIIFDTAKIIITSFIDHAVLLATFPFFSKTIQNLHQIALEEYLKIHNCCMHHLFFFPIAFYFFHYSFYEASSFFRFHISQLQNIFRQYDPPLCTLCRIQSNGWNNKSVALFDHDGHKEDTRCSFHLQNSNLSKYDLFQRFRTKC